jgi:nucleotide-binding universal stress UspA family protein
MPSKFAVGVDLSAESEHAVAHAVAAARHVGAPLTLILVDVVPDLAEQPPASMKVIADRYTATLEARLELHRGQLAALRERWTGHGVELSQVVVDGYPDERLPVVAHELGADLLVVGSHGRTGFKRFLIGSVAEQVARRADISVLIARGDAPDGGYRRVVMATDFSTSADHAMARALPLVARGGRIDLVHCWQLPWAGTFGEPVVAMPYDDLHKAFEASLHQAGNRLRAALGDRTDVEVVHDLLPAPPAQGVVDVATGRQADLIVVGSHGRRGVRRFVLGSVAEVVIRHAACSVLVAR